MPALCMLRPLIFPFLSFLSPFTSLLQYNMEP